MRRTIFFNILFIIIILSVCCNRNSGINRYDLVTRHNIENSVTDSLNSLSVGNGEFAFTVDLTGLQTFPEFYSNGISLGTMSNWGWHTAENPEDFGLQDVYRSYDVHGSSVDYPWQSGAGDEVRKREATAWLLFIPVTEN